MSISLDGGLKWTTPRSIVRPRPAPVADASGCAHRTPPSNYLAPPTSLTLDGVVPSAGEGGWGPSVGVSTHISSTRPRLTRLVERLPHAPAYLRRTRTLCASSVVSLVAHKRLRFVLSNERTRTSPAEPCVHACAGRCCTRIAAPTPFGCSTRAAATTAPSSAHPLEKNQT